MLFFTATCTSCDGQKSNTQSEYSDSKEKAMNLATTGSTAQLMNEDKFWKLIDQSRVAANSHYQTQIDSLKTILLTLDAKEIETDFRK